MNKEQLVEKFTAEKRTAFESIGFVREQISRLQGEERKLIENHLRLEGCLHALEQLLGEEEKKPLRVVGENTIHDLPPPEEKKEEN